MTTETLVHARLCAGLIFEVSCKTKDEAVNNETAIMQVFRKYKEVNEERWNALRVNLISLTNDGNDKQQQHESSTTDTDAPQKDTENGFHRLYVFYPATFEIPCEASVLEETSSSPEHVSHKWVELSKERISEEMKKDGVEILTELWDLFRTQLGLDEQKTMPLNVIGITENASSDHDTITPALTCDSNACGSGSCGDAKQSGDGDGGSSGETPTGGASSEI